MEAFTGSDQIGTARRSCLAGLNPDRDLVLPSIEGLDVVPFSDQVSSLYSINSLLGYRYQPGGELNPLITYVQTILDQPTLNYTKEFEDYALARAEAIIYDREDFSREERTELNRVVDRIGI